MSGSLTVSWSRSKTPSSIKIEWQLDWTKKKHVKIKSMPIDKTQRLSGMIRDRWISIDGQIDTAYVIECYVVKAIPEQY